jgi:hypothetical protein
VKVQTLGILAILLIGLLAFVLLIPKTPLETLVATPTAGRPASASVSDLYPHGGGVRVCQAVVKACMLTGDVEERPPIRCREAYPRRTDRTGEPA